MTVVNSIDFYDFMVSKAGEAVECEACGKEMKMPETDDLNADMEEPWWIEEEVHTYIGGNYNKMKCLCDTCYQQKTEEQVMA